MPAPEGGGAKKRSNLVRRLSDESSRQYQNQIEVRHAREEQKKRWELHKQQSSGAEVAAPDDIDMPPGHDGDGAEAEHDHREQNGTAPHLDLENAAGLETDDTGLEIVQDEEPVLPGQEGPLVYQAVCEELGRVLVFVRVRVRVGRILCPGTGSCVAAFSTTMSCFLEVEDYGPCVEQSSTSRARLPTHERATSRARFPFGR